MQCIDAIEGMTKAVIQTMFDDFLRNKLDDSEYIRNIKSVIQASDCFLKANNELMNEPETFSRELYRFAKSLWLQHRIQICPAEDETRNDTEEDGYYEYYFDYLYQYGKYPM
jgi:hypothetical protein